MKKASEFPPKIKFLHLKVLLLESPRINSVIPMFCITWWEWIYHSLYKTQPIAITSLGVV